MIPSDLNLHPVRIPMRHRFRWVEHRDAVLIEGSHGWGEFSPFPEYSPEVAKVWLAAALELANGPLPDPIRDRVPVNVTIPAVGPDRAGELVLASGATTAKVKVAEPGQETRDDLVRVEAVREVLGEEGRIRVDANAAWDVEEAAAVLENLSEFDLEYVEQPVRTIAEMIELKSRTSVPLAADELIRNEGLFDEVVESGAADVIILKVQPMGGIRRVLDLAGRTELPVVISSAVETSVGMYGGVLAAASLRDLPYACGLGTVALLGGDPTHDPLLAESGWLEVRRPVPAEDLLERWHPDQNVTAEIMERFRRAFELLT